MALREEQAERRFEVCRKAALRWRDTRIERAEAALMLRKGGPMAADNAEAVRNFTMRAAAIIPNAPSGTDLFLPARERVIGTPDFADLPGSTAEQVAGQPIARIVELTGPGHELNGYGTGFVVAPGLLITNNHVLPSANAAAESGANFGYERSGLGINRGKTYRLEPSKFFLTNEELDFTIVALAATEEDGAATLDGWGRHTLIPETGKVLIGQAISIIQHPNGGPKKYARTNNEIVNRLENHLHYRTDTDPGASGSAGFNINWEVVVLHHAGVWAENEAGQILNIYDRPWSREEGWDQIKWIANEGVRISKIYKSIAATKLKDKQKDELRLSILGQMTSGLAEAALPPPVLFSSVNGSYSEQAVEHKTGGATVIHVHGSASISISSAGHDAPLLKQSLPQAAAEGIFVEAALTFDPEYGHRRGYDPAFLPGLEVPVPSLSEGRLASTVCDRHGNPVILDYHHFSLAMDKDWKLPVWTAVNADYSPKMRWDLSRKDHGDDTWRRDPRIAGGLQIEKNDLYGPAKKFDLGHVVRRVDAEWGSTLEEVKYANADTFHYTNCTPQHERFNRSNLNGVWGNLENHIETEAGAEGSRLTILAGPVLDRVRAIFHDFGNGSHSIPLDFWKIVLISSKRGRKKPKLRAFGFLLEQEKSIEEFGLERAYVDFEPGEFRPFQISIQTVAERTGITFPDEILEADTFDGQSPKEITGLETLSVGKLT
ncbi:DNA/RNA non-specific endonuclease [Hyphomonas sp.]|uniref:DNA/RNA non-specific endonuclease n=1 Tax=Hyphomonas sp. TaxID=87 RepID=UPI0025BD8F57|nr:DNA/RNA non-specific endonuclease [Hyphomonas sp.]